MNYVEYLEKKDLKTLTTSMEDSSSIGMSQELSKIQLVKSDTCPPPNFCAILEISMKGDLMDAPSSIPPKVIMVHDAISCYMCSFGEVRNYEIREAYDKLCNGGILKDEFKFFERKGLTHALEFCRNFKIEWVKFVLSISHDMKY